MHARLMRLSNFVMNRMWGGPLSLIILAAGLWSVGPETPQGGRQFGGGDPGIIGIAAIFGGALYVVAIIYNFVGNEIARQQRIRAPRRIIQNRLRLVERMPEEFITPQHIQAERNVEVRNALIRRIGIAKYMDTVGAMPGVKDDWGQLYEYTIEGRTFRAVKVPNSTPEPDGTFKDYWLRIPHNGARQPDRFCIVCGRDITGTISTPKQAIAWTFSLCDPHYNPVLMS